MNALIDSINRLSASLAPAMLPLLLRSTAILCAGFAAAFLLRRASAAARHAMWIAVMGALLALPLLAALPGWQVLPRWSAPAPLAPPPRVLAPESEPIAALPSVPNPIQASAPAGTPARARLTVGSVVFLVWLAGLSDAICATFCVRGRLRKVEKSARPATDGGPVRLLQQTSAELGIRIPVRLLIGRADQMPMAWGILRPRILLPQDAASWSAAQLRAVLRHELAHVERRDCLTHLIAQLARAVYWFNPLAWLAVRAIHAERERACDDLVLRFGARQSDYASQLLRVAAGRRIGSVTAAAMAMARPSQLEGRIRGILDASRSRRPLSKRAMAAIVSAAAAALVPIAGLRSAQPQPAVWPPAPLEPGQGMYKTGEEPDYVKCVWSLMHVTFAIHSYAMAHEGLMPPDLGCLLETAGEFATPGTIKTLADRARLFLSPEDLKTVVVPEIPTPEWVNRHTSFVYLGAGDIREADVPDWQSTILVHARLDQPHRVMHQDGSIHETYCVAYMDGHGWYPPSREDVDSLIGTAKQTFAAAKNGADAADHKQAVWDLQKVGHAIRAYAEAHGGQLPPTLGASLPYVPSDSQRLSTAAQRAAIFLSPARRRELQIPETPSPEWVNEHASYTYLGGDDLRLQRMPYPRQTVLLHGDLDQPYPIRGDSGHSLRLVPFAWFNGSAELREPEKLKDDIARAVGVLDGVRGHGEIPALAQAVYDTQRIGAAVRAYAKAHDDHLPPDLGATLAYLDADRLLADTAAERARVYLSPAAQLRTQLPTEVTPEWVNQHSNYVYLGNANLTLTELRAILPMTIVVHSPLDEYMSTTQAYGDAAWIAVGVPGRAGGMDMAYPIYQFKEDLGDGVKKLMELRGAR